ncbi:glutamate synthase large subunit [Ferrimicrobium sp.]|uniref:glutamate synthase large subunit n=2 Tax=Ferrimicrobium TaxID=121038 RepID=UPI0026334D41|nr:glutamate synthase large subunit [Ferrimicrobium sp.]
MIPSPLPPLYPRGSEHDACGIAFITDLHGGGSHKLIEMGLGALVNLEHRGAKGSDPDTGDGAGILIQNPDDFWRLERNLPPKGAYVTGLLFIEGDRATLLAKLHDILVATGWHLLDVRTVPRNSDILGAGSKASEPDMVQLFLEDSEGRTGDRLERKAWLLRSRVERALPELYFPSLSSRTFIFKGMLSAPQVEVYFRDLQDHRLTTGIVLVHSRFSTNTFPSWRLAQPFRMIAHNGEINTIDGNRNWMRARESLLASQLVEGDLRDAFPLVATDESDSASLDGVFEMLALHGRSLPHAMMMMIPEAWEANTTMKEGVRDFYRFHASLMEPWDGPAAVVFTDGTLVGGVLDRNGLRPARYWVTDEGLVILASEVGVIDIPPSSIITRGRLEPGRIFLVDTSKGAILDDAEVKESLAELRPWGQWLTEHQVSLDSLAPRYMLVPQHGSIVQRQQLFGYTEEELRLIITPMATQGQEPIGSMGSDTPLAARSEAAKPFFDFFYQRFAQVTNPPLDAIREELVTSYEGVIGPERNLLEPGPESVRQIRLPHPVIDNDELAKLMYINEDGEYPDLNAKVIDILYPVGEGELGLRKAINDIRNAAEEAIRDGYAVVILSDRHANWELAPIPSLLAVSAIHHHLVRTKLRTQAGLVIECGDAREVHHFATLISFGAAAVNPYLAFDSIVDLIREGVLADIAPRLAVRNYVKAATKGIIKVMSKMGISTIGSYTGAQVFEIYGLSSEVVEEYFPGARSPMGGNDLADIAATVARHHHRAYASHREQFIHQNLETGGQYQWRRDGEYHLFNPETVFLLQHSTRRRREDIFRRYTALVDDLGRRANTLRGLLELATDRVTPIPIDEVEPIESIVSRFSTGAMSYGSISQEAHETLAIAMNRLGGRSNTGEGGEDPERAAPTSDGLDRRSKIRQIASGRFGVSIEYLSAADDIQIKMAQGAKPGEGGQLPGEKVYPWIAKTRNSTPGVGLISPPPHHDIYSIEDLAQLIYDLKSANPRARVHVKLVSEVGVGTVAAGVVKAHADVVLISGGDGGTGAAPLNSLKHAGGPWEIGLAETVQTLVLNGLRDRVVVQVDGQLKTGRDVIVAALLGAEEYGFATAPLVVSGCIMMRVCHLDTCPVGIATQNPELRTKFTGKPEFVETFFQYIAQEVREYLAQLGLRSLDEAIGRADLLKSINTPEALRLGLDRLTYFQEDTARRFRKESTQDILADSLNQRIVADIEPRLSKTVTIRLRYPITNTDRAVGATLGDLVTRRFSAAPLAPDSIALTFDGSAGQSFGAFAPFGVTMKLHGDANDYVGKGLSGARLVIAPDMHVGVVAENTVVTGNVALYGAIRGELFVLGRAGERFAVRNSGATAVVEGVGDHGCEYMTGGVVVILGSIGRNFAAGMSGGLAFIWDPSGQTSARVNQEMVDLDPLDDEQFALVKDLLERHARYTGSSKAASILAMQERWQRSFVCVYPKDLKRVVLQERAHRHQGSRYSVATTNRGY